MKKKLVTERVISKCEECDHVNICPNCCIMACWFDEKDPADYIIGYSGQVKQIPDWCPLDDAE